MYVHKFRDNVEFDVAFIVACNDKRAGKIMRSLTHLEVTLVDCRDLSDFPHIEEHFNEKGEGVYMNRITPF